MQKGLSTSHINIKIVGVEVEFNCLHKLFSYTKQTMVCHVCDLVMIITFHVMLRKSSNKTLLNSINTERRREVRMHCVIRSLTLFVQLMCLCRIPTSGDSRFPWRSLSSNSTLCLRSCSFSCRRLEISWRMCCESWALLLRSWPFRSLSSRSSDSIRFDSVARSLLRACRIKWACWTFRPFYYMLQ